MGKDMLVGRLTEPRRDAPKSPCESSFARSIGRPEQSIHWRKARSAQTALGAVFASQTAA
eukprot:10194042-Alexandrium_andersonii.AAC.1